MLTGEFDAVASQAKQNEREIRRLRVQMDKIASGGVVRSTAVGPGPLPPAVHPVEWYFNANLLGLGVELELLVGGGVWISGTFVGDRAYYEIGAYPGAIPSTSISGVDVLLNDGEFCFARALDFHEGAGVWISGSCTGGEAIMEFGAYPCPTGTVGGGDDMLALAYAVAL